MPVGLQKTVALFHLVLKYGTHAMPERYTITKTAWISIATDKFSGDPTQPGPLATHKMFTGHENQ